ncbi:MAG: hypothetical protein ACI8Y4_003636 [Candidatus Poriferisodalaceae bacterium]|jgi:hypothetical protein
MSQKGLISCASSALTSSIGLCFQTLVQLEWVVVEGATTTANNDDLGSIGARRC